MSDKKAIASVIKTLERAIGILETSNDVGEFSYIIRKRIIEMLNSATMDVYFINIEPNNKNKNDFYSSESEKQIEPEVDIPNKEIRSVQINDIRDVKETIEIPRNSDGGKFISEDDIESPVNKTANKPPVNKTIIEEFRPTKQKTLLSEEIPVTAKKEVQIVDTERFRNKEVSVERISDKPIFEWEDEDVFDSKNEMDVLKHQLDEERKRLEQELQNWQAEKQKREEEMFAAKKLLEALQHQQHQQQNVSQTVKPQPDWKNEPIINNRMMNNQPTAQERAPIIDRQQSSAAGSVRAEKPQETLIDRFATKKVLHENFETNIVNQISTPVSSLTKAIGINDRFRFIRELFGGDSDMYGETIKRLDNIGSLGNALSYIESSFSWDKSNDSVKQLISLVRRRYM